MTLDSDMLWALQRALDGDDQAQLEELLQELEGEVLSQTQLYFDQTVLMYALRRCRPTLVKKLLDRGLTYCELPFSDNNELKAALGHPDQAPEMVRLVLDWLPEEVATDMIETDWSPDEEIVAQTGLEVAEATSPELARQLRDFLQSR